MIVGAGSWEGNNGSDAVGESECSEELLEASPSELIFSVLLFSSLPPPASQAASPPKKKKRKHERSSTKLFPSRSFDLNVPPFESRRIFCPTEDQAEEPPTMPQTQFRVGMTCDGCSNAVKRILTKIPGVDSVETDVANKSVVVQVTFALIAAMKWSLGRFSDVLFSM